MRDKKKQTAAIETKRAILRAANMGIANIQVDMGEAKFGWKDIPLNKSMDTLHLPLESGSLKDPVAVSMGNPHAVFFVENVESIDLARLGPGLETNPLFPERANIGVAQILSSDSIRLRVFERGVGETRACGSGACAAVVGAARRGLIKGRHASVFLPGGTIDIDWLKNGRVLMTGPVNLQFEGKIEL
jgi:diaminopimelate epimerase